MMIELGRCPTHEELIRMTSGDLPVMKFESVCQHVESCQSCQTRLSELDEPSDEFTKSLSTVGFSDLERVRLEMEAEAREIATSVRDLFGLGQEPTDKLTTLKPPCRVGPYEIRRIIGRGGMGEVYEARHVRLDRLVAIKVIRGNRQEDPVAQAHFLKEMTTAGKFDHPNLVRAYDTWEEDGQLYLALELLDGLSVHALAKDGEITSAREVTEVMIGTCKALEHLHHNELVHCDVKPANVMRLQNGTIKLIDFGLATSSDPAKGSLRSKAGTKGYLSPEQEDADSTVDHRSDIYSAGCLLKFLLKHLLEMSGKTLDANEIRDLDQIAQRMTRIDPNDRYQTASEVITDLERLMQASVSKSEGNQARRGFAWLGFVVMIFGSLGASAWQIAQTINQQATLVVKNAQLNDVLILTSERGPIKSFELGTNPQIIVPAGSYTLSLKSPANRSLSPSSITVTSRDQVTVAIAGIPKPFDLKMVEIPAGQFVMGGIVGDPETRPNELPRRTVSFAKPFRMSAYEITVGQFREFVTGTGYLTEAEATGLGGWKASKASSWGEQNTVLKWSNPGYPIADSLPVTLITYADAVKFCDWLSKRDGQNYRLPTEAEWEYACRAGTTGAFHFPFEDRDAFCWSQWNVKETARPRPVGTRQPNAWGLFDMCGNVREWCLDWYADKAYEMPFKNFPNGPATGDLRVIRSGCFMDMNAFMMSSHRGYLAPAQALNNQGFRVVQDLP